MSEPGVYLERVVVGSDWPEFVYLTRDSDDWTGELSDVVEVWADRPVISRAELSDGRPAPGCGWFPPTQDSEGLLGRYSLASARHHFRTVPETDHECVKAPRG